MTDDFKQFCLLLDGLGQRYGQRPCDLADIPMELGVLRLTFDTDCALIGMENENKARRLAKGQRNITDIPSDTRNTVLKEWAGSFPDGSPERDQILRAIDAG